MRRETACVKVDLQKELTRTKLTKRIIRGTHAPFPEMETNITVREIAYGCGSLRSIIDTWIGLAEPLASTAEANFVRSGDEVAGGETARSDCPERTT